MFEYLAMDQDTSPEQQERYFDRLRAMTPVERMQIVSRLVTGTRRLAEAGIRMRHPNASDAEVRVRLAVRIYGREFAGRFFAELPADAE